MTSREKFSYLLVFLVGVNIQHMIALAFGLFLGFFIGFWTAEEFYRPFRKDEEDGAGEI